MVTGKDRVQMDAVNKAVSISNVHVKPGDLVVGDESGVVIVPRERAEEIFTIATEISEKERQIENEVESGSALREARRKHGYHMLQRPRD
jgi:regulator of RNase E activity RraA